MNKEISMQEIDRRLSGKPEGDQYVEGQFADPINKTYPIASESHIRSAWRYINNSNNTTQYDNEELETIKARIRYAANQNNIDLDAEI